MTPSDFEFVIEESTAVAGGVKVTGRVRCGRVTSGEAGWLQERGNLAIAVGRIDVEAAPGAHPGRMILVLRGLPVAMVTTGAMLRSHAWISDGSLVGQHASWPAANTQEDLSCPWDAQHRRGERARWRLDASQPAVRDVRTAGAEMDL